jgi:hypothetical protein
MDQELKRNDELGSFLAHNLEQNAPFGLDEKIMNAIEAEVEKRKVTQPLIGRSTWIMMALFVLVIILLPVFIEEPSTFEKGMENLKNYGEKVLNIFKSIWVYIVFGFIVIWEFLFRRVLKVA